MKTTLIALISILLLSKGIFSQTILNGGFENWTAGDPNALDNPDYWVTSNQSCQSIGQPFNATITSDAKSGNFALQLETIKDSGCEPFASMAICKNCMEGNPLKLTGYYKADLQGEDYSSIRILLTSPEGAVGTGILNIEKSSLVFTRFEVPIVYIMPNVKPDSFTISIISSVENATAGTVLIVDDLSFESNVDVTIPLTEVFTTKVTPNPATYEILVEVPSKIGMVNIRIYDTNGRTLEYQSFENQLQVDVSNYTQGLYFYEVRYENKQLYDKGRFKVSRPTQ